MRFYSYILITCGTLFIFSCDKPKKEDAPAPASTTQVRVVNNLAANLVSGGRGHFTFFNLQNNTIVPASDSATTNWDIAFNATTIIANSGTSGPGTVGMQMYTGLFETLTTAPELGYLKDATGLYAISTGSGNGWYNYNSSTHVISAIPGRILIVKTNNNAYAKIEIISYYLNAPVSPLNTHPSRYYTFRYRYQGDGTRTF